MMAKDTGWQAKPVITSQKVKASAAMAAAKVSFRFIGYIRSIKLIAFAFLSVSLALTQINANPTAQIPFRYKHSLDMVGLQVFLRVWYQQEQVRNALSYRIF